MMNLKMMTGGFLFFFLCFRGSIVLAEGLLSSEGNETVINHCDTTCTHQTDLEVWRKNLMLANESDKRGDWSKALTHYLKAWTSQPFLIEPLFKIAKHYSSSGEKNMAYLFAKEAYLILSENPNQIFSFDNCLEGVKKEINLLLDDRFVESKCFVSFDDILSSKDVPSRIKECIIKHVDPSVPVRSFFTFQKILFKLPLIGSVGDLTYCPCNPSIQKTDQGYDVICRTVNYSQTGGRFYKALIEGDKINTKNFFLRYDENFNLLSQKEIIDVSQRKKYDLNCVEGLEDCRLFKYEQDYWMLCTTFDTSSCGDIEVGLAHIKEGISHWSAVNIRPVPSPFGSSCEKNWLPFIHQDHLYSIYQYDPFTIYRLDVKNAALHSVLHKAHDRDFSRWRGSAAPISYKNGYLFLVHEVYRKPDFSRLYVHRLVFMDDEFNIKKASHPFVFQHKAIEFCTGFCLNQENSQLVFTIGIEDKEAYFAFLDINLLDDLLKDLE
ncbi:MAG: hypothetical protein ACOVOR_04615 [Rhabdochlamydiaceae bacterium]